MGIVDAEAYYGRQASRLIWLICAASGDNGCGPEPLEHIVDYRHAAFERLSSTSLVNHIAPIL